MCKTDRVTVCYPGGQLCWERGLIRCVKYLYRGVGGWITWPWPHTAPSAHPHQGFIQMAQQHKTPLLRVTGPHNLFQKRLISTCCPSKKLQKESHILYEAFHRATSVSVFIYSVYLTQKAKISKECKYTGIFVRDPYIKLTINARFVAFLKICVQYTFKNVFILLNIEIQVLFLLHRCTGTPALAAYWHNLPPLSHDFM